MGDWIIGGIIIALAGYLIVKQVKKMKKGECASGCGCCKSKDCPSKK